MKFFLLAAAAAVTLLFISTFASAHICLLYPIQRGPAPDLTPGDARCYNRVLTFDAAANSLQCGNLKKGPNTATFIQGTLTEIKFEQNLNHWFVKKETNEHGYFNLRISYDGTGKDLELLSSNVSDFPAFNMNSQQQFSVPVRFTKSSPSALLVLSYVSFNPDERVPANNTDAIFYSCADIEILPREKQMSSSSSFVNLLHHTKRSSKKKNSFIKNFMKKQEAREEFSCVTPPTWTAQAKTVARGSSEEDPPLLIHQIEYDTTQSWLKWNRRDPHGGSLYDVTDLWNLTSAKAGYTPQYVLGLKGKESCSMFGGDKFFKWSFGEKNGMQFMGKRFEDGRVFASWEIASSDFEYVAEVLKDGSCLPSFIQHGNQGTEFEAHKVDSIPSSTFAIPSFCDKQKYDLTGPDAGCRAHDKMFHHRH